VPLEESPLSSDDRLLLLLLMNSAGPCRILGRIACGLLLPMFRGLCVSVSLLDTTAASPAEADELIDMPFGLWTRLQSPRERGAHLGGGACGAAFCQNSLTTC